MPRKKLHSPVCGQCRAQKTKCGRNSNPCKRWVNTLLPWQYPRSGKEMLNGIAHMPILHMTAGDWMRCLDNHYASATYFDNAVEFYRRKLELPPMEMLKRSEAQIISQQCNPRRGYLFSKGDHRIWHMKAKRWAQKLPGATYEISGSESTSLMSKSVTHCQTELVEAAIGHGLLRDVDLNLLVEGESAMISECTESKNSDRVIPSVGNTNEAYVTIEHESEWRRKARAKSTEAISDENWIWAWLDRDAISVG